MQITYLVKGERPTPKHIAKALLLADNTQLRKIHLTHCEQKDLFLGSMFIEFDQSLLLKLVLAPPSDIHDQTRFDWVDLSKLFRHGTKQHLVIEAKATSTGAFQILNTYTVDEGNTLFMNSIGVELVREDTVVSVCGSVPQLLSWEYQVFAAHTGHGTSVAAAQLDCNQAIEFKQVISERYSPLWRIPGSFDVAKCLLFEPYPYWNKVMTSPDQGKLRFVWSKWGNLSVDCFDVNLLSVDAPNPKPRYEAVYKQRLELPSVKPVRPKSFDVIRDEDQRKSVRVESLAVVNDKIEKRQRELEEIFAYMSSLKEPEGEKINITEDKHDKDHTSAPKSHGIFCRMRKGARRMVKRFQRNAAL